MNIGNNLRHYRRERDLTQEELANVLGVSFQAVSKWERGEGYPDITLLPAIAAFFKTTVDELLGMSEAKMQEELQEIHAEYSRRRNNSTTIEDFDRASEVYREAVKKYPNNWHLLLQLGCSLEGYRADEFTTPALLDEAAAIYERIAAYCPDAEMQINARANLATVLARAGRREQAVEEVQKLPLEFINREFMMSTVTRGEEQIEAIQSYIYQLQAKIFQLTRFAAPTDTYVFDTDGDYFGYTNAERIRILQIGIDALELTRDEGDVPLYPFRVGYYYRSMAQLALMDGEDDKAIDYLERAADYAFECDKIYADGYKYSYAVQNGIKYTSILRNRLPVQYDGLLAVLDLYDRLTLYAGYPNDAEFDEPRTRELAYLTKIRENPRYIALIERLKPRADELREKYNR
ncbi:MAG: helix-turn-helix domain-containing protein [Oscillospiraceae bacterium]|jgi:transcriptional regulator with XRE-family HTH domain|nr:helix-turn-helix domain-containing protein [Oscillospiraceae bacterium]